MPANLSSSIAHDLLAWYDANARVLPWRAPPGAAAPDPYRVWLSEIMLQQTTVATVRPRFADFVARWPDLAALAAADESAVMAAWAGLGYYSRARNLIACARAVVEVHGGRFPDSEAVLRALPGIGDYTAAAIAAIAFGRRAVVIDGNVERVVARLFAVETPLPGAKPIIRAHADGITPDDRAGDFAQAMMDLGSGICTPRGPKCLLCPLQRDCRARALGTAEAFPVRPAKPAKPQRYGTIFWLEADGRVLLVRRPPKGLLGGMRALPTGRWSDAAPGLDDAPIAADWRLIGPPVTHVFTHFRLELALAVAGAGGHSGAAEGEWWPIDDLESAGLPTVFAKAAAAIGSER
ncbi:A/G-specific adenine glycosylase [Sphingomonas koreensis]|nr:A/G-specific adenine glycosylase [Sphingomonas koreensis]